VFGDAVEKTKSEIETRKIYEDINF